MKVELRTGRLAHLKALVMTANYRQVYRSTPDDPTAELLRIAAQNTPETWRPLPTILLGDGVLALHTAMASRSLPPVMVIAEFVTYLGTVPEDLKSDARRFVWLQDSLDVLVGPRVIKGIWECW